MPRFKLLRERLIELTDRTGTGSNPQQGLGYFSHLIGTCPGHELLRQPFSDVRFIATVALERLCVELTRTVSGNLDLLEPTPMSASSSSRITPSNTTRMAPCARSRRY